MKKYLVKLKLIIGGYEKQAHHLVEAVSSLAAGSVAIVDECHGNVDWIKGAGRQEALDCGEMVYKVYSTKELNTVEWALLQKLL